MANDLQKGNLWKRISAGMFDSILTGILAVAIACLLSLLLGYNRQSDALDAHYAAYEQQFGVTFDISLDAYDAMTQEQRQNYDAAYAAMSQDPEVTKTYQLVLNLYLVIITLGTLSAIVLLELVVPLWLKEGRTLGKKIFGLCVIHAEGIRMNKMQLFVRTVLGKFTVETMIPIYILLMLFWGITDLTGTLVLLAIPVAQCVIMAVTRTNSLIHDLLAGTVVVDYASQMIFGSREELIEYQKAIAAERARRQTY